MQSADILKIKHALHDKPAASALFEQFLLEYEQLVKPQDNIEELKEVELCWNCHNEEAFSEGMCYDCKIRWRT